MKENNDYTKLLLKKILNISTKINVKKGNVNSFGGFNYRSLEDIYESLKPLLNEEGAFINFQDSIEVINNRYYYVSECRFYSIDIGLETYISSKGYARETDSKPKMDEAQVTGSASSYSKKYALCSLFLIDEGTDPDKMDNTNSNTNNNTNDKNNKVKISNYIQAYYNNKDYELLKNSIADIAKNETEENKALLRKLLSNIPKLSINELKNTSEYKSLLQ